MFSQVSVILFRGRGPHVAITPYTRHGTYSHPLDIRHGTYTLPLLLTSVGHHWRHGTYWSLVVATEIWLASGHYTSY